MADSIRILEITEGIGYGGAEVWLRRRLRYSPTNVETVVINVGLLDPNLEIPSVKEVRCLEGPFRRAAPLIEDYIRETQPDIVIFRIPRHLIVMACRFPHLQDNSRIVFEAVAQSVSESPVKSLLLGPLMRLASKKVDLHVAVSRSVAKGPLCAGAKNTVVNYTGASGHFVPRAAGTQSGTHFLALGRLVPVKRPLWLAQIVYDLREQMSATGSTMHFVGGGPLLDSLQGFVRRHDLDEVIYVHSQVRDLEPIFAQSDVLVISSTSEGIPVSLFEAKLAGLRVISTPVGGVEEVLEPRDVVLSDLSSAAMKRALLGCIQAPQDSQAERTKTAERFEQFHSSTTAAAYYSHIESSLGDNL